MVDNREELQDLAVKYNLPIPPKKESNLPKIGGFLILIAGLLIITQSAVLIIQMEEIISVLDFDIYSQMNITITPDMVSSVLSICGTTTLVLAIFPILGGIQAWQKKRFYLVVIGGVIGTLALAPLLIFIPNILSLIGLIIIVISKQEFKKEKGK